MTLTDLPSWVDPARMNAQLPYVEQILESFDRLKAKSDGPAVVFLPAPTGSGKTLMAELVRRNLPDEIITRNDDTPRCRRCRHPLTDPLSLARGLGASCAQFAKPGDPFRYSDDPGASQRVSQTKALYTCTTKSLQRQFAADFDYAAVLMGRANYPTLDYPERFADAGDPLSCADCTKVEDACDWCAETNRCPYVVAKARAIGSDLAVTNTAYFLAETNYARGNFAGWPLVVLDEAHRLEQQVMRFAEVYVSKRTKQVCGISDPERKTVETYWPAWCRDAEDKLRRQGRLLANQRDPKAVRRRNHYLGLANQLSDLASEIADGNWVHTGYERGQGATIFKPVEVSQIAPEVLWSKGDRFLLMSATFVSPQARAEALGIDNYEVVDVPSQFDPVRRPVFISTYASMTHKTKDEAWPVQAEAVEKILRSYPGQRALVHAVSYEFAKFLCAEMFDLPRPVLTYSNAAERDAALESFRSTDGAVLIAPSMQEGVDLPDEACRLIIIPKVPYPNLGDKQVRARFHKKGGGLWFRVETIATLVQMAGRGMRHAEDSCDVWVLDEQIHRVMKENRQLFPEEWTKALRWDGKAELRERKANA